MTGSGAGDQRLWAVRGATKVGRNDAGQIVSATEELMRELLSRNELQPEAIVSCIFTCTHDLNAEFPAVAARNLGLDKVPLLCGQEIDVPNSMRSIVRVLVHYYSAPDHTPAHTYLGEAEKLRSDLKAAQ
jgi:chorismate mutase